MPSRRQNEGEGPERRVKSGMLGQIVKLATQLQMERDDTLTQSQIEEIGRDLNIDPAFIRQAIAQSEAPAASSSVRLGSGVRLSPGELSAAMKTAAFAVPIAWGVLALLFSNVIPYASLFFGFAALIPLAILLSFLAGTPKLSRWAIIELMLALSPLTFPACVFYVPIYFLFSHKLIETGLALREESLPLREPKAAASAGVSRQALLDLLFRLESQLENQKQRRAFLSIDVVGSSQMMLSSPELAVEATFSRFRAWVEEIVRASGGEVQSVAGDGAMALFHDEAAAVRAARRIQTEIGEFNAERNRLPSPFRVRCGVCAGEVALEEGVPLREIQSPAMYRAAMLQKRAEPGGIVVGAEVEGAARRELEALIPVSDASENPAFAWRSDDRLREGPNS